MTAWPRGPVARIGPGLRRARHHSDASTTAGKTIRPSSHATGCHPRVACPYSTLPTSAKPRRIRAAVPQMPIARPVDATTATALRRGAGRVAGLSSTNTTPSHPPSRLRLLEFLLHEEHTVTECVAHAGLAQSRVSTHLSCLADCGYVAVRRVGRHAYYQVADPRVAQLVLLAHALAADNHTALCACHRISRE